MFETATLELLDFIRRSPVCYHAVANLAERLEAAGYVRLRERDGWSVAPGGKYYVLRGGSSIIAFAVPEGEWRGFRIAASHSDSPCFKLKPDAEMPVEGNYVKLNVEKYGGMILSTWLDRPLSIAGRLTVRTDAGLETRLVDFGRDAVLIPNLAIHMERTLNDGYKYTVQRDMLPLFGGADAKGRLLPMAAEAAGVEPSAIMGSDLFLYHRMAGSIWGAAGEFVSAPRLDDLQCAWCTMTALLSSRPERDVNVCCVFDNEEVGSGTMQGADSTFLSDTLCRITAALGGDGEDYLRAVASSFLVSADNAHAVHPNRGDAADPVCRPVPNGGVVIKHNANQKYTTDGVSEAVFRTVCAAADVPVQDIVNHGDMPGGSTLGNISTAHVSVRSVDIGLAQLAMHSSYETAGERDTAYLLRAMTAYFGGSLPQVAE